MNFFIDLQSKFPVRQLYALFFLAFHLPTEILSSQISRSKSSPDILLSLSNNEQTLLQNYIFPISNDPVDAYQETNSTTQSIPSTIPLASPSISLQADQNLKSYGDVTNCALHADTSPLRKKLAESSLKHAPQRIRAIVNMLKNRENLDIEILPKKLLLVGDPGTGKTTLGKAIAHACKMPFVKYTAASIADRYKDSGSKNLEKIFYDVVAQGKPYIIIIDELEALIKRYDNKNDSEAGMLITLWTLLDQFENSSIFFIGTLNNAKDAPQQIKNRFSEYIEYVPLPNTDQRKELIQFYISSYKKMNFKDTPVDQLVKLTNGFAPRNIKGLMQVACQMAYLRNPQAAEIVMDDFLSASKEINKKAVYLRESRSKQLGDKWLKWGPTILNTVAITASFIGTGIAWMGYLQTKKSQHEGLTLQKEGINLQSNSIKMQESSFKIQRQTYVNQYPWHHLFFDKF